MAMGQPSGWSTEYSVTSVCDMRCTHCFFTDELDDRPRKLQMKTNEIDRIAQTLGGNLGVLILAAANRSRARICRRSSARSIATTISNLFT
jgi:hypothetical protein